MMMKKTAMKMTMSMFLSVTSMQKNTIFTVSTYRFSHIQFFVPLSVQTQLTSFCFSAYSTSRFFVFLTASHSDDEDDDSDENDVKPQKVVGKELKKVRQASFLHRFFSSFSSVQGKPPSIFSLRMKKLLGRVVKYFALHG